ncbi:MAG: hybrid sensor histidine kinase/response regulator, partial [Alphaproteobacteria bacterium]|nr:hybrid sensor histidine kinase/response regulator [Alphaproteobacteria bacterium]
MASYSPSILIIDDTEANRYAVARILKKNGYITTEARTAAEGIAQIARAAPDLIILDIKLSDKNGFILCAELKADQLTKHIPVMLTSASFVEGRDKAYGLDNGADGYLTTPIDPLELVATVRALLRIREAERNLKETDDRLRLMVESVTDYAIFSIDLDGRVSTWNSGAEHLFGYGESEIIGRDGSILYTPDDRQKDMFRHEIETAGATGRAVDERWHIRKDGRRFFATGIMTPVTDSLGRLVGYTKVSRDITLQKETEAKLQKSQ